MDFLLDVVAQGLAYGILAIGVLLTYQVLDYADLTVEGSFPLGLSLIHIFHVLIVELSKHLAPFHDVREQVSVWFQCHRLLPMFQIHQY